MEFGIENAPCKSWKVGTGIWENESNYQIKKNQNARRKGNLQILRNLETDTNKQVEMKGKIFKKSTSRERENNSKPNYIAGTL